MAGLPTSAQARRRRLLAVAALVVVAAVAVLVLSGGSAGPKRLVPGGGDHSGQYDPLAYAPDKEAALAASASAGFSDPVWEKSPGGALATARRVARWRPLVETAARSNHVDPDLLEAIVFLESAGRPDAMAGGTEGAVGLTQIVASTATSLLGMHVDLARSSALTARIAQATNARQARKLEHARRQADQRYIPAAAVGAAARYLAMAKKKFGRDDLAVATYHMGMGNLEHALSLYSSQGGESKPSYTRLYFDTTPLRKPRAYAFLSSLGDESSTYLWRVLAAKQIMALERSNPAKLGRLDGLEEQAGPGARRLYPGGAPSSSSAGGRPPAYGPRIGLRFSGSAARSFGPDPGALAALVYLGAGTKLISGQAPLDVTSAHGVRIEIARHYRSRRQALAFQYMLDRLQAWNLIAWGRGGGRLAIVTGPAAKQVLPSAQRELADLRR